MRIIAATLAAVCVFAIANALAQEPEPLQRPADPERGVPAPPDVDIEVAERRSAPPDELQRTLRSLEEKIAELERQSETIEKLRSRIEFLERDNAALVDQMRQLSEGAGNRILANLNTDARLRHELAQAANPPAAVKFYNWKGETVRMNVNGSWYNLPPGPTTIRVGYGPVAVTHCDKETPRTFTDWTPAGPGFVMAFDVGDPAQRTAARR